MYAMFLALVFMVIFAQIFVGFDVLASKPVTSYETVGNEKIYQYEQKRDDGSVRTVYSTWDGKDKTLKGSILHFQGSGCKSAISKNKNLPVRMQAATYFIEKAKKDYWIFGFEKRGVKPFDTVVKKSNTESCSKEYHDFETWDYRVEEAVAVLKYIKSLEVVKSDKIVIIGFSEGTDIVIGSLVKSNIPTHAGYFAGGGTTQMFDLIILGRKYWYKNILDVAEKEKKIEEMYAAYQDIMKNPTATDKFFQGHPYKRWSSFFKNEPDKLFLNVDVPVFLAHGTNDESVPIESIDYLQSQFILHGKNNITIRRYAGLDHAFSICDPNDPKCQPETGFKQPEVIDDFLKWLRK